MKRKTVVDLEMAKRLRQAREAAGYARPADAIAAFGFKSSTYFAHENGTRGFGKRRQLIYASAFRVRTDWLVFGRGAMYERSRRIPIEGYVGQAAMVVMREDEPGRARDEIDDVELPPGITDGTDFVAYRVLGDVNYPAYRDRDVLFVPRAQGPPGDYLDRECVVTTSTGDRLIRTIIAGTRAGLFLLLGYNTPPLNDVEVIEAAPVVWIKRG